MPIILLSAMWFLIGVTIACYKKTTLTRPVDIGSGRKPIMEDRPYLIRWTLFSCKWFSVKLHKILLSDTEESHDHPWSYISIILWGGYWEYTPNKVKAFKTDKGYNTYISEKRKWYRPGSILFREGHSLHKLGIPYGRTCLTLVITGRKYRDWGFLTDKGWKKFDGVYDSSLGAEHSVTYGPDTREKVTSFIRQRLDTENNPDNK